jgi:hypothetical protein
MTATTGSPGLRGLDGIEIKLNFTPEQIDDALRVFGLSAVAGKPRRIWFGEVLDGLQGPEALPLSARGVIVRVRAKRNSGDVTVKLRGPDGGIDVRAWRESVGRSADAKIEGDWASRRLVSASLGSDLSRASVDGLNAEPPPSIAGLLSSEQRRLADQMLVPLEHVALLGPITATKWEAENDGDVEAELWVVGSLRFLEVSLLVTQNPDEARDGLRERAAAGGLDTSADQETKTAQVLRHLAAGHP